MNATQSVLLYGVEVWVAALNKEMHNTVESSAQVQKLGALQVASEPAMMMTADVIFAALLSKESKAINKCKGEASRELITCENRQRKPKDWKLN